ncbi:hypothetical protein [Escherichia phage vB_EcoM_ULIM9]|nr:hypothetical protein [Escherichia phage vB_EcoM_ULIM9]
MGFFRPTMEFIIQWSDGFMVMLQTIFRVSYSIQYITN